MSIEFPIDPSVWGQFGDFLGGTLGIVFSLISVMLVVWTFKTQHRTAETQRFNDLFFELLRTFQSQEKELQYEYTDDNGDVIGVDNKDFFEGVSYQLFKDFQPQTSFLKNRRDVIDKYLKITLPCKAKLTLCYKTIFQLLSLIENGNIGDKEKKEYLKILRSQFTENELLFLRYHIISGKYSKFAFFVNKSNLMRHLPLLYLVEFKYWKEKLGLLEIKNANDFFLGLFIAIRKNKKAYQSIDGSINVIIDKAKSSLKLKVVKRNAESLWFSRYSEHEFENLCEGVMKELVMFSNYSCYNNYRELYFASAKTINNIVTVEVANKKNMS